MSAPVMPDGAIYMAIERFIWRRGMTFHFRRRLDSQIGDSNPISISMKTRDPDRARILARRLASRWDMETIMLGQTLSWGLSIAQRSEIYKAAMREELDEATAHWFDHPFLDPAAESRLALHYAAAFDTARQDFASQHSSSSRSSLSELNHQLVNFIRDGYVTRDTMEELQAPPHLERVGAAPTMPNVKDAILIILAGWGEARRRCSLVSHPEIQARSDRAAALLDEELVVSIRLGQSQEIGSARKQALPDKPSTYTHEPQSALDSHFPFARCDKRRFTDVIPDIIMTKRNNKEWKEDKGDHNRVLQIFGWVTGDKPLCDYRQSDITAFIDAYEHAPAGFRWMEHIKAQPQLPWNKVKAGFSKKSGANRSPATYNRDAGVLQAACQVLGAEDGPWQPRSGNELVLEIGKRKKIEHPNPLDPKRMPWTPTALNALFRSAIFTGGGGYLRRLEMSHLPTVWHDAAYWVPLLAAYSGCVLNELCGLEVQDVVLDCVIPHLLIRDNITRSKDGVTRAGAKTQYRIRHVPLHREILRLGFADYVQAVSSKANTKVFPELYTIKSGGGAMFYARAWVHIVNAVDALIRLPRTSDGKRADFHSLRTYSESILANVASSQAHIDRILGHVSAGTGVKHYNRRMHVIGIDKYLGELLQLMEDTFVDVTGHLQPSPIKLLPLKQRSRTGSVG
jgi:integrase